MSKRGSESTKLYFDYKKVISFACVLSILLSVISVGTVSINAAVKVSSIAVEKSRIQLFLGKTERVNATISPADAQNKELSYYSYNPEIAVISQNGIITANSVGTTVIQVSPKDGSNVRALCNVEVKRPVKNITLNTSSLNWIVGKTGTFKATVTPSNATNKEVKFTSSNSKVATVTAAGKLTAVAPGTATITCAALDGSGVKATCKVTVKKLEVPVSKITLNTSKINWTVGRTGTFKATVTPSNATYNAVRFTSGNSKVATVTTAGKLTAIAPGTATITCSALDGSGVKATCTVTVKKPAVPVTKITLNTSKINWLVGRSGTFKATVIPSNATYNAVKFTSSNSKVATVTTAGKLTAVSPGTATITCAALDGSGAKATCKVTVTEPVKVTSVKLNTSSINWLVGRTGAFKATVFPENATDKEVKFTSSNSKVATVTAVGKLTAVSPGTATITCAALDGSGAKATCKVTVTEPVKVTSVKLNTSSINWLPGRTGMFKATVSPENATDKEVKFTSSNSGVASVTTDGKLTAVKPGTATITCTALDGSGAKATCKVTVTEPPLSNDALQPSSDIESLSISPTSTSIYVGNHAYINPTVSPATAKVIYSSSNTSVATINSYGIITGVSAGSVTITAKSEDGTIKKTKTIKVLSAPSNNISISNSTAAIPQSKSFYLRSYTSGVTFSSSNTKVATVTSQGYIYAKAAGVAIISVKASGKLRTCAVRVTSAAPVRFAYTSPNSATLNDRVYFYAITDKTRNAVKFTFTANGRDYTVEATSKTTDSKGLHYVWKGSLLFKISGEFKVTAYSQKDGKWSTCNDGTTSVYVSDVANPNTVSFNKRRPSDKLLQLNATYEGFLPNVTDDPLVSYAPTLGHGKVIVAGEYFYNNLSREEAYAYLVDTMNEGPYASAVNEYMQDYNIKFNQQQFDALVMLVYNLGSGVLYNGDVKAILTDCYQTSSSASSTTAYVNSSDGLWLRSGPGTGYSKIMVMPHNTKVTILSKSNSEWFKVKLSDGTTGYCYSEYLRYASTSVRNLNYVDKTALKKELIQWHHAGGQCIWGLLYRRIDELEIFCYGDYTLDGRSNKYNMSYNWNCY